MFVIEAAVGGVGWGGCSGRGLKVKLPSDGTSLCSCVSKKYMYVLSEYLGQILGGAE